MASLGSYEATSSSGDLASAKNAASSAKVLKNPLLESVSPRQLTVDMTLQEKIGQMMQIDISLLLQDAADNKKTLNMSAVEEWIGLKGVGSVLNFINDQRSAAEYRHVAMQIQQVAKQYNRPPVIWGIDSVHGANYLYGAVVTPQPLNIAATFNTTTAYEAGKLASRDTRAAGMNWLFSPLLGIALHSRWSRVFETFGEDPVVVGSMAAAMIRGIQEPDANTAAIPSRAAASAKHFLGYSMPHNGHDRSPSWIPTRHLYQYFVPPWKRVAQQVLTVMESYTETNGVPLVANRAALDYLLRWRLGFGGVLVTDYHEIRNLYGWHHVVDSETAADQQALRQGSVDMSMMPYDVNGFLNSILDGVRDHRLAEDRITVSAERVMQLKHDLGMMTEVLQAEDPNLALVGTDEALAMDIVRQSIILAKNENYVLPLKATAESRLQILVTGPTANSRAYQSGGWTGTWQGVSVENENTWFTYGATVLGAFSSEPVWDVSYRCGVDILGNDCNDAIDDSTSNSNNDNLWDEAVHQVKDWVGLDKDSVPTSVARAVEAASTADVVVIGVGEEPSSEKPGDIRSLELPQGQYDLVQHIKENTKAKIILVYFGGRPRLLREMIDHADAVLLGFLPGPSAGQAVVDIVLGRVNPNGRLPITYPMYDDEGGVPYFHSVSDQCTRGDGILPHWEYVQCPVQWPFGHGLSYTTFEYSDFTARGGIDQDLELSVTVRNTGEMGGAETVVFFTFDDFRVTTPEYKRLRGFDKVYLEPGGQARIQKTVPVDELRFVGPDDDTHYILDPKMTAWVGVGVSTDCRVNPEENDLCVHLKSDNPSREYVAACEAACDVWAMSGCGSELGLSNKACVPMCSSIAEYPASPIEEGNQGWGWNYVRCLESVVQGMDEGEKECWKMTSLCRDIFRTEKMNEFGLGPHGAGPLSHETVPSANFVALVIGLICTWIIVVLMRGGSLKPKRSDIEFAEVNTQEEQE